MPYRCVPAEVEVSVSVGFEYVYCTVAVSREPHDLHLAVATRIKKLNLASSRRCQQVSAGVCVPDELACFAVAIDCSLSYNILMNTPNPEVIVIDIIGCFINHQTI